MKSFLKKSLVIFTMLISILGITSLATTTPTYAAPRDQVQLVDGGGSSSGSSDADTTSSIEIDESLPCRDGILGMQPWDCHIIQNPASEDDLKYNFFTIATNIATDISVIAAYLVIGYTIYGGYLYIFASGDTGKVAAGKKTLTHAFIGLAIVGLVNVILNSIHFALLGSIGAFDGGPDAAISAEDVIGRVIQWFIGIAGAVSAIYVVIGGIGYMTSAGDSAKLQKAKNTIFYALLGLAIVALSLIITNFVIDIVNNAEIAGNAGEKGGFTAAIQSLLNSIILIGGTVCVIYIVLGGARYITSTGDPGKIQKAKSTILYACIGLVICALAFAIVNFTINAIYKGDEETPTETSLLEKPIAFLEEKL